MQVSVVFFLVLLDCLLQVSVSFCSCRVLAFEEVPVCFGYLAAGWACAIAGWLSCVFGGT